MRTLRVAIVILVVAVWSATGVAGQEAASPLAPASFSAQVAESAVTEPHPVNGASPAPPWSQGAS